MRPTETFKVASLLLSLVLAVLTYTSSAQTAGTFKPTGNMTTPRFLHMATLLADGRVLIAGGVRIEAGTFPNFFKDLASAELYNPLTGAFTPTGEMTTPRTAYTGTLTLLPDGKVLAAGGRGVDGQARASAEIYDPRTGRFTVTGDMTRPRFGHTATVLNNDKVLIAAGSTSGSDAVATAELYDPATGTFTATGIMNRPGADTATLLPSGKVLITRGNSPPPFLSSAELYDPVTGTFASAGYMRTNHTGPTAILLASGDVLVAGGDIGDGDGSSYIAELFNPATGGFVDTGNMVHGREQNTANLLPDGTVLFTGSHDFVRVSSTGFDHLATAELYDPVTGTFRSTGSMATGRELHAATLLNDGTVLVTGGDQYWPTALGGAGGRDPAGAVLASAEIYIPAVLVPASVVTDLKFDPMNAVAGSSYSITVSGSHLTQETFFDVRFISPESNESAVVLNWQKGLAARHDVPAGTASGVWTINGVRAHQLETDHSGNFVPVSATITVSP
jgi:hypothetical protein